MSLLVWPLVSSCEGDPPNLVAGRWDSAGIEIVQLGRLGGAGSTIQLAESPDYRVGWDPDGPLFEHVVSGIILHDRSAAVGDRGSNLVTVLRPSGEVARVFGGPGEGPGEIGALVSVVRRGLDTILVEDDLNGRISLYFDWSYLRSVSTAKGANPWALMARGADEGGLLMSSARHPVRFPERWLRGTVAKLDLLSGRIDTLRTFDWILNETLGGYDRFAPMGMVGWTKGALIIGRSDKAQYMQLDGQGRMFRIVRWEADQPTVSEADWDLHRNQVMTDPVITLDRESRAEMFSRLKAPLGEPLPFFGSLHGDEAGNVWVGDYSTDDRLVSRFQVFSPEGDWIGSVSLPDRFQVLDIGLDRILGVQYDDLEVPSVVVYRIEW